MIGGGPAHLAAAEGPAPPYRRAWLTSLEGDRPRAGPIVIGEIVVVVAENSVVALDAAAGSIRWQVDRAVGPAGSAASDGEFVVHGEGRGTEGAIVGRTVEDGEEVWRVPVRAPSAASLTVAEGLALAGLRNREVVAVDIDTGEVVWKAELPGRVDTAPAVAEGRVVVVAENFSDGEAAVVALDIGDGTEVWDFAPEGARVGVSSATVADGVVYVGLGDGSIRALDAADATQKWQSDLRLFFSAQSTLAIGDRVAVVDRAGHLYGLDLASGVEQWVFRLPGAAAETSPVLIGDFALVGDSSSQVSAIDGSSGLLVWKEDVPGEDVAAVAPEEERFYVASEGEGGAILAFEHDPDGGLLAEPSPTTLFPIRALANFAGAFALVTLGLLGIFRLALPAIRSRRSGSAPDGGGNGRATR